MCTFLESLTVILLPAATQNISLLVVVLGHCFLASFCYLCQGGYARPIPRRLSLFLVVALSHHNFA